MVKRSFTLTENGSHKALSNYLQKAKPGILDKQTWSRKHVLIEWLICNDRFNYILLRFSKTLS